MAQEAGADAGEAEGEDLAVDLDRAVLQRAYEIVGGVLQGEQVAAVFPALEGGNRDERLDGAVARAGPVPREGGVDPGDALLHGDDRVRHRQGQVLVRVDADLRLRQHVTVGADAFADVAHGEPATGD